jgi:hypothetical protein
METSPELSQADVSKTVVNPTVDVGEALEPQPDRICRARTRDNRRSRAQQVRLRTHVPEEVAKSDREDSAATMIRYIPPPLDKLGAENNPGVQTCPTPTLT